MPRGRPPAPLLSRERILETALKLAAERREPTLGRISKELGVHVSSLYGYIDSREHLTNLLRDHLASAAQPPALPMDWEAAVREFATGVRALFEQFPGLVVSFAITPVDAPDVGTAYAHLEARMRDAGLPPADVDAAVRLLNSLLIGSALEAQDPRTSPEEARAAFQLGVDGMVLAVRQRISARVDPN